MPNESNTKGPELVEAPHRVVRLVATVVSLVAIGFAALFFLLLIGVDQKGQEISSRVTLFKPWLLGALGGIIGGDARALYAFLLEALAVKVYRTQGKLPKWMLEPRRIGLRIIEGFDYMIVWYIYLIKPAVGALLGIIFASLLKFGLIPFFVNKSLETQGYGILIGASFAGIFVEDAMKMFGKIFDRAETSSKASANQSDRHDLE